MSEEEEELLTEKEAARYLRIPQRALREFNTVEPVFCRSDRLPPERRPRARKGLVFEFVPMYRKADLDAYKNRDKEAVAGATATDSEEWPDIIGG